MFTVECRVGAIPPVPEGVNTPELLSVVADKIGAVTLVVAVMVGAVTLVVAVMVGAVIGWEKVAFPVALMVKDDCPLLLISIVLLKSLRLICARIAVFVDVAVLVNASVPS
jgi:hypothetical protein